MEDVFLFESDGSFNIIIHIILNIQLLQSDLK